MHQLHYVSLTVPTKGQVPHATVIVIASAACVFPELPVRNVLGAAACNAAGEGFNAQYGGSCDFTRNFTMGEEVIHGCYRCVHIDEDEEEMDVDTPSLRASILKEE